MRIVRLAGVLLPKSVKIAANRVAAAMFPSSIAADIMYEAST
jgi:hypothetical protein